jgi:hypothetical protein
MYLQFNLTRADSSLLMHTTVIERFRSSVNRDIYAWIEFRGGELCCGVCWAITVLLLPQTYYYNYASACMHARRRVVLDRRDDDDYWQDDRCVHLACLASPLALDSIQDLLTTNDACALLRALPCPRKHCSFQDLPTSRTYVLHILHPFKICVIFVTTMYNYIWFFYWIIRKGFVHLYMVRASLWVIKSERINGLEF